MEEELNQRVRDALETPPLEKAERQRLQRENNSSPRFDEINAQIVLDLSDKNRDFLTSRRWRAIQAKNRMHKLLRMNYIQQSPNIDFMFRDELSRSNHDEFPGVFGLNNFSEGIRDIRKGLEKYPSLRQIHRHFYTKEGFLTALHSGKFPDGSDFNPGSNGCYVDRFGVIRDSDGPFWPGDIGPLFPTPRFSWFTENLPHEPLFSHLHSK